MFGVFHISIITGEIEMRKSKKSEVVKKIVFSCNTGEEEAVLEDVSTKSKLKPALLKSSSTLPPRSNSPGLGRRTVSLPDSRETKVMKPPLTEGFKSKTPPGQSEKFWPSKFATPPNQETKPKDSPNQISFQNAHREFPISPLSLTKMEENVALSPQALLEFRLFIFRCVFADGATQKRCWEEFFCSSAEIEEKIPAPDKQVFFKCMLENLTRERAQLLLSDNVLEGRKKQMEKILNYINQTIPPKGGDINPYIKSIAHSSSKEKLAFPYADILDDDKINYIRQIIREPNLFFDLMSYSEDFFQFILASSVTVKKNIGDSLKWLSYNKTMLRERPNLYQHLMQLLETSKPFANSGNEFSFAIVLSAYDRFIKQEQKPLLDVGFDALLSKREGRKILYNIDHDEAKELFKLLNHEQKDKENTMLLFAKIMASLSLNIKEKKMEEEKEAPETRYFEHIEQVAWHAESLLKSPLMEQLLKQISPSDKLLLLENLLALNLFKVDLFICQNTELMLIAYENRFKEILIERAKSAFSFKALTTPAGVYRAFCKNKELFEEARRKNEICLKQSILTTEQVRSIVIRQQAMNRNGFQALWVEHYQKILALILAHWEPTDEQLCDIVQTWYNFNIIMTRRLENHDTDAYDPKHYVLTELPRSMREILELKIEVVEQYQQIINAMTPIYGSIIACIKAEDAFKHNQQFLIIERYCSFITLMERIAERRKIKASKKQFPLWAEKLTNLLMASENTSTLIKSCGLKETQLDYKTPEIFYIKNEYVDKILPHSDKLLNVLEPELQAKKRSPLFFDKKKEMAVNLNEAEARVAIRVWLAIIQESSKSNGSEVKDMIRHI